MTREQLRAEVEEEVRAKLQAEEDAEWASLWRHHSTPKEDRRALLWIALGLLALFFYVRWAPQQTCEWTENDTEVCTWTH